jgi:hypothetical protein
VLVTTWVPRSTSVIVTLAPATTALLASFTTPAMPPESFCAAAGMLVRTMRKIVEASRREFLTNMFAA